MSAATLDITIDRAADWSKVITVTDSGGDPVVLTPAVAGVRQVNTATTVGTVSGSGYLAVIFTSALTGSVSKRVAVVAGDTPTVINAKICQEFNTDPRFAAHFRASYSTSSLIATAHAAAANDSTVNWDLGGAGTDAAGVTPDATSTNTTAGVAQVFGAASFKGQLSVRPGGPPVAEFRFEIIAGGDENQVRVVLPQFQTAKLSSEQVYHFDWFAYTGGRFLLRHVQGTVKVRGNSTILGTSLNPATTPSGAIAATWGAIVGTLSDQTDLQAAIDAAGGGGSNSITSSTTSDGTANLSLSDVTTVTSEVTGTLVANHIHGNLAGNVYAHVRAGENLAKGDPVYVSGSHGSGSTLIAEVSKADASNAAKMPAVGIMDAAVSANANGHMVITGTITELNTNAYTVNAELYVASGGGFTATPPSARAQPVARVERVNANNGAIIVKVNGLSASDSTANTLVRRNSSGGAMLYNLVCDELDVGSGNFQASALGNVTFGSGATVNFNSTTYTYGSPGAAEAHRIALGAGTTGAALFQAATAEAANSTLGNIRGVASSDVTATTQNVWVDVASVALTTGTWRVQAFYHGSNASSSATNTRLSASANWSDTNGRRIGNPTGSSTTNGITYATGGTSSAINVGTAGLVSHDLSAVVKMTGSGTLSLQVTNTAATGTATGYSGSHIIATKLD